MAGVKMRGGGQPGYVATIGAENPVSQRLRSSVPAVKPLVVKEAHVDGGEAAWRDYLADGAGAVEATSCGGLVPAARCDLAQQQRSHLVVRWLLNSPEVTL